MMVDCIKGKEVTCLTCGTVHFEVSLEYVTQEVAEFNAYFDTLSVDKQHDYYGGHKSSVSRYAWCKRCGGSYTNFRDSVDGDCPIGATISPILNRNETN